MAGQTYLGIDVGTSVVKAVVFDESGDALAMRGTPIPLIYDGGRLVEAVEQDFEPVLLTPDQLEDVAKALGTYGQIVKKEA